MTNHNSINFTYSFFTTKSSEEVYAILLEIDKWWSGLHSEIINGTSKKINDEFSFSAGNGVHYSNQKLIELIPNKKIVWLVTESNLSFLKNTNEWANTKLIFDILQNGNTTKIVFTHEGLIPEIECYDQCTNAWTKYLKIFEEKLK